MATTKSEVTVEDRGVVRKRRFVTEETGVGAALIFLIAVIGILNPDFLQFQSIATVLRSAAFIGLIALGMVFLLSMQELDLSVGAIFGLTAMSCALMIKSGIDPWIAAIGALILGALLGAINATISNVFILPGIIVTLGTLSVYRGLTLITSDGTPQPTGSEGSFFAIMGGNYFGIAMSVWVLIFSAIVLQIVYRWTRYGALVRAIGSNPRAAAFAGIPVKRIRLITYMLTGFLSGMAGILSVAYFRVADPSLGSGTEIAVIAAAIIGGTALSGGSGTVIGALLGATLISVINSGLVYFGVSANWGTLVTGLVILGAVMLDSTLRQKLLSKLRIRR